VHVHLVLILKEGACGLCVSRALCVGRVSLYIRCELSDQDGCVSGFFGLYDEKRGGGAAWGARQQARHHTSIYRNSGDRARVCVVSCLGIEKGEEGGGGETRY